MPIFSSVFPSCGKAEPSNYGISPYQVEILQNQHNNNYLQKYHEKGNNNVEVMYKRFIQNNKPRQ